MLPGIRSLTLALASTGWLAAGALAAPTAASAQGTPPAAAKDTAKKKKDLPLEPARKVAFTTSKGSWISVDVSPDGQTLVFDLLGDLYTLPIGGGTATRLTSGMALDVQPRFSPDGKKVVFVSDRSGGDNVWVMSLDGKDTVQVTKGNNNLYVSPTWSPDGKYVIAAKSGGIGGPSKLWMYDVDGGTGVQLNAPSGAQSQTTKFVGPAFGPDPRYVWYAARQGDWQYNAIFPQYQLGVYDREAGTHTVMSSRYGSAFRPALSPDGKWLAYASRHESETGLRLRDLASGEEQWLVYPIQRDDQESRAPMDVLPGYAFTPDAKALVISYGGEIWRVPVDRSAPTKLPFTAEVALDAGPEVRFAYRLSDSSSFVARQIRDLAPAPDGRRFAFTVLGHLYVIDSLAATPRMLADIPGTGEFYPAWSPDGKSIAFVTWQDGTGGHLWKVAADGRTKPQQLTRVAAQYMQPAWSPDGRRIVADRAAARDMLESTGPFGRGLGAQFVWVPSAGCPGGCDATVITTSANRSYLHFTSDTTRLFAYSRADGLVSFRWDGTDVKSIVKVTGPMPMSPFVPDDDARRSGDLPDPSRFVDPSEPNTPPPPASLILMAPKGDRALAQMYQDFYVIDVPRVGGPAPTISVASPEAAAVPVRRLTDIGGEFPSWSADGRRVHWSIGNALVVYDLDRAKAVEDSLKKARPAAAGADSAKKEVAAAGDSAKKDAKPGYKPEERRITVTVERDIPRGTVVLRGARVITMKGREVIEDADLVVRDNRIAAVGKRGTVAVPAGAQVIDVAGKTIAPGFVDTHAHMWPQWGMHVQQPWLYLANLAYGVTTTRDPQTSTTDVLTYADQVEAGRALGPRVFSTGPGVFGNYVPGNEALKDLDHARTVLKRYSQYYDTKTIKMYMAGNRQQRQWVIMAAKELGLMPTTEGGLDYKLDLTHALDGYSGIEHAVPIVPLYEDVVQMFAKTGVTNTPTLIVAYGGPWGENFFYTTENVHGDAKLRHFTPESELDEKTRRRGAGGGGSPGPGGWFMQEEYAFPKHAAFVKSVVEAGGRAGVGSHGQLQGLGYHWELQMIRSGGMSTHDVLRTATMLGAEALGMAQDIGSIEDGKLADLVIMDRNPLDDIKNTNSIAFVMKNGRLYEGNTLDEVWPRKRKLPTFVWQQGAPAVNAGLR